MSQSLQQQKEKGLKRHGGVMLWCRECRYYSFLVQRRDASCSHCGSTAVIYLGGAITNERVI